MPGPCTCPAVYYEQLPIRQANADNKLQVRTCIQLQGCFRSTTALCMLLLALYIWSQNTACG